MPLVEALLRANAAAFVKWGDGGRCCGQAALHLAAAGGLYVWEADKEQPTICPRADRSAEVRQAASKVRSASCSRLSARPAHPCSSRRPSRCIFLASLA